MAPLLLATAAAGGALVYWFDRDRGRARRARMRDKFARGLRVARESVDAGTRDIAQRSSGIASAVGSLAQQRPTDDRVLVERLRAKMGRYVSHPRAVGIRAVQGEITLSGSILRSEHAPLLNAVSGVHGVRTVHDHLAVYDTAQGVPELQGGRVRRGERFNLRQANWARGTRIVTGATGAMLLLAASRGGVSGLALGIAGTLLLARTAINKPLRQLAGIEGTRAVEVQKTITIQAPLDRVFQFLADHRNYPHFMHNVKSVTASAEGRTHWTVAGPAGMDVEWDAVQTQFIPNQLIAWRTVEGSKVAHEGSMRFQPEGGGTRVHIRMTYSPRAGVIGHHVAKLFGADAKSEMDQDLMRLKTTLETGTAPHDAAAREATTV
ncbi:MAG: SRPBCC family protein [Rhodospirillaceae bacterium]